MTNRIRGPCYARSSRVIMDIKHRKLRWSWRYNTWQVNVSGNLNDWRNIRAPLARCYAAAGLEILMTGDD